MRTPLCEGGALSARCAERDHRRSEVLLGLGYVQPAFVVEAESAAFGRDLIGGHAVQADHHAVGFDALAWSDDLPPAVDGRAAALVDDRQQPARIAHAGDLAG